MTCAVHALASKPHWISETPKGAGNTYVGPSNTPHNEWLLSAHISVRRVRPPVEIEKLPRVNQDRRPTTLKKQEKTWCASAPIPLLTPDIYRRSQRL